jgi:hypothetical protein
MFTAPRVSVEGNILMRQKVLCGLREQRRNNFELRFMKNSKPAQHLYNVGHKISWTKAAVSLTESNNACRTQSEQGHVACVTHPVREISYVWISLIHENVTNLQGSVL